MASIYMDIMPVNTNVCCVSIHMVLKEIVRFHISPVRDKTNKPL